MASMPKLVAIALLKMVQEFMLSIGAGKPPYLPARYNATMAVLDLLIAQLETGEIN